MLIGRRRTGLAILALPVLVLLGLGLLVRLGLGFALPSLGMSIIAAAGTWMWWDNRERDRRPLYSPQESRRAFARMLAASAAAMTVTLAGITFVVSAFPEVWGQPSDDRCERSATGEPDRDDPDCHGAAAKPGN